MYDVPHERILISKALDGDRGAFTRLVEPLRPLIYRKAVKALRDPDEAEDIAQEVIVRAYTKLHTFRQDSKFSTWLFSICSRCILMHIRSRNRKQAGRIDDVPPGVLEKCVNRFLPVQISQEDAYVLSSMKEDIRKAINDLPPKYNRVIILWAEGHDLKQISHITDSSVPAIKSRIFRARNLLRSVLGAVIAA